MKPWVAWSFAAVFVIAQAALADEPAPPAPPPEKPPEIALEPSFSLPQPAGGGVSHVPAVVFLKDGSVLVTGTSQGEVVFWEAATRKIEKKHKFADSAVAALAIDPSAKILVALLDNGALQAIDLETGKTLAAEEKIAGKTLAISPAGDLLAIASGPLVELRKLPSLEAVKPAGEGAEARLDLGGQVNAIAFSPDGTMIAACTEAGFLRIVGPPQGGALGTVYEATRPGPLYAVAFAPDSKALAYGGQERVLYQADIAAKKDDVIATGQPYYITAAGYSPDGETIAIGDESCDIWLFDVRSKKNLFHSKHHVECWLNGVAWAPDNETFLFACRPNTLAATPSLHMPNVYAEAQLCDKVRDLKRHCEAAAAAIERLYAASDDLRRLREELELAQAERAEVGYGQGLVRRSLSLSAATEELQVLAKAAGEGEQLLAHAELEQAGMSQKALEADQFESARLLLGEARGSFRGGRFAGRPRIAAGDWFGIDLAPFEQGRAVVAQKRAAELDAKIAEIEKTLRERPELASLNAKLDELRKQEQEETAKEVSRLSQSFNINQWKLKKK